LARKDPDAVAALFHEDCYWRDLVSFTWNIKTMEGQAAGARHAGGTAVRHRAVNWRLKANRPKPTAWSDAWLTFDTAVARGRGHLRLKDGLAWTLLTTMTELKGHEEKTGTRRIKGAEHGVQKGRQSWQEKRQQEERELGYSSQPYCVIIGGGQGGMALGARLKRLGVPTIIVDTQPRAGDSWRNRYKSLCLHDPVWYDHLPYLPFPDDWPVFAPKDKIGDWLEMYTRVMELNYWSKHRGA
jgi:putative flavoprotein involved in K+ transport